jgi:hypothetical protein
MVSAERIYSFRADTALGARIKAAAESLAVLAEDEATAEQIARELAFALYRNADRLAESSDNQSALLRRTAELFVAATEKVAEDRRYTEEYARLAEDLTAEEREGAEGMRRITVERWRDE